ncbi:MAG: flavin-containing monooxygenase [Acidimicrobiales bacterium]|jgi:cation diffusion facilitator CzcD-associated flavoprotein CzcO
MSNLTPEIANQSNPSESASVDVVIVGAGFGGMYMLHKVRELGLTAQVFERGTGVGGTWYWNRYPGARCDVESLEYSYSFDEDLQQEWEWTERFAPQPEILTYANHVADRFDLRSDIQFETSVAGATFDETSNTWAVRTDDGSVTTARFFISAVGCLSSTNVPDIPGKDTFAGLTVHTGLWPKEGVDFEGKRVGIIGVGSSGVQSIPVIAEECDHLFVFQRTPQYTVPARNGPLDPAEMAAVKAEYPAVREANEAAPNGLAAKYPTNRDRALEASPDEVIAGLTERWERGGTQFMGAFRDLLVEQGANDLAGDFVRDKISQLVDDPETANMLTPTHTIGCKRLVVDTDYYKTFNRSNVSLVDVTADPIEAITSTGMRTASGHHEFDILVFATGFDAMTGSILNMDIVGREGLTMGEAWSAGPRTFLGLATAGFPNFFTVTGPGSPSVLANMILAIQQHVEWIARAISHLDDNGLATMETTDEVAEAWVEHVNAVADRTLFPTCNSWYLGANVPGKTRVFMPLLGYPQYKAKCEQVAADGYDGFVLA